MFKFHYVKSRGNHPGSCCPYLAFQITRREQFIQQAAEGSLRSQTGGEAVSTGSLRAQFLPGQPRRAAVAT